MGRRKELLQGVDPKEFFATVFGNGEEHRGVQECICSDRSPIFQICATLERNFLAYIAVHIKREQVIGDLWRFEKNGLRRTERSR